MSTRTLTGRSEGAVLLTGATGFVGMELLARHLEDGERDVIAIIRAADQQQADRRLDAVLENLFGEAKGLYADRVSAVPGDLTKPGLGLSIPARHALAQRVATIVHCAASVSFGLTLQEARDINLKGTARMLAFATLAAEQGGLERYAHVSTAYVGGTHPGRFSEQDLQLGQEFRNSYEQSKFEAEALVRAQVGLPATILRPSIVVGDSHTGWTTAFNVLYWPLRAFDRNVLHVIPALPGGAVDVVSVDFVADAIFRLCQDPATINSTYHLTAGENTTSVEEIVALASEYFDKPGPRIVTPEEFAALLGDVDPAAMGVAGAYLPYFFAAIRFDTTAAEQLLGPSAIEPVPISEYMSRLLDYATATRWGKRPVSRAAWSRQLGASPV